MISSVGQAKNRTNGVSATTSGAVAPHVQRGIAGAMQTVQPKITRHSTAIQRAACGQCEYTAEGKTCYMCGTVKAKSYAATGGGTGSSLGSYVLDTFDEAIGGCVVLKSGNWVVVIEKYQLKHNPDLSGYLGGGSFKGKKGSTLDGGYAAHQSTYAPEVLAAAKKSGYTLGDPTLTLGKQRLKHIEAYISINTDNDVIVVTYHGNPPG